LCNFLTVLSAEEKLTQSTRDDKYALVEVYDNTNGATLQDYIENSTIVKDPGLSGVWSSNHIRFTHGATSVSSDSAPLTSGELVDADYIFNAFEQEMMANVSQSLLPENVTQEVAEKQGSFITTELTINAHILFRSAIAIHEEILPGKQMTVTKIPFVDEVLIENGVIEVNFSHTNKQSHR
jgi:hypothetical protein